VGDNLVQLDGFESCPSLWVLGRVLFAKSNIHVSTKVFKKLNRVFATNFWERCGALARLVASLNNVFTNQGQFFRGHGVITSPTKYTSRVISLHLL